MDGGCWAIGLSGAPYFLALAWQTKITSNFTRQWTHAPCIRHWRNVTSKSAPKLASQGFAMFVFLSNKERKWPSLQEYTFIMPAVSVGHIGQLVTDLVINSLKAEKIARLHHPVFIPVVGSDPYDENEKDLMTASELYICEEKKIVILQIRSFLVKEKCIDFLCQLIDWIRKCNFSKIILLSSCHGYERIDCQLVGSPFRFTTTDAVDAATKEEIQNLRWTSLEARQSSWKPHGEKVIFYPGGGYTNQIYTLCEKLNIPLVTLLIFCDPGDNIPGVLLVASHLNEWLKILPCAGQDKTPSWKFPVSWRHFFANDPPETIF